MRPPRTKKQSLISERQKHAFSLTSTIGGSATPSYPDEIILLALADITACFRFARLSADIQGAFGFVAEELFFTPSGHVFGSNTSASSWEPFRRAIKAMITVYARRDDLIEKHKILLNELMWFDASSPTPVLVQAFRCDINRGVVNDQGTPLPMEANIYVDDILAAAAGRLQMLRLLAATIEAIFTNTKSIGSCH